ncbi:MAG: NADH-quinone oxidoreductase subunit C [Thaumarchaeota archaeon]|nr:NADH-quinone oxidoreductase subunit C [Candidatus Calditenuaceae archaeon]MDW8041956.1 NADH-quinone oxidoreductase subunit C [Nitrososphaerota archaeon]
MAKVDKIIEELKAQLGDKVKSIVSDRKIHKVEVDPSAIVEVAAFIKERGFDHVKGVTGVDLVALTKPENAIEVMYHAGSYTDDELVGSVLTISVKVPRDKPETQSLVGVWKSAEYHERETFEMLGVVFKGHPDLRRLLLPEWWSDTPPLRKDYRPPGRE